LLSEDEAAEASTLKAAPVDIPTVKIPEGIVLTQNAAALELVEQINQARELEQLRKDLNRREEAVDYAQDAVDFLLDNIQTQVVEISRSFPKVKIDYLVTDQRQAVITSEGYGVKISWQQPFNTLQESQLLVVEYRRGRTAGEEREFAKVPFNFDVSADFQPVWQDRQRIVTTDLLARECVNRLMTLLKDRPEAEQIGKDPLHLSEDEVRQPESTTRKTKDGLIGLLRFNMPATEKSSPIELSDDISYRGKSYVVYEKRERRYPEVSEDCDEYWLIAK
jgi:hypothetical protein